MDDYFHSSFRVRDVYDLAKDIVVEFERLADICGLQEVRTLVIKVVNVLEQLEANVVNLDVAEKEISNLKLQNIQLRNKKAANDEDKMKLEQDLEQIEESWKHEIEELKLVIVKLQEENKQLHNLLEDQKYLQETAYTLSDDSQMQTLRALIGTLNSKLKEKDNELSKYISLIEHLNKELVDTSKVNENLHIRLNETQNRVQALYNEKLELAVKTEDQEKTIKLMEQRLNDAFRQQMDLLENSSGISTSPLSLEMLELENDSVDEQSDVSFFVMDLQQQYEVSHKKIVDLEEKLSIAQEQAKMYKKKLDEHMKVKRHNASGGGYFHSLFGIRQLFHLFLEVEPPNFRNYCS